MSENDPTPPVADDDFPEFSAPPRHKPPAHHPAREAKKAEAADDRQGEVDDMIARLRRERAEGKR